MSYGLSFAPSFFRGEDEEEYSDRPTSVAQALRSQTTAWWWELEEHFKFQKGTFDVDDVLEIIKKTNICSSLDSPVTVWIDEEGYFSVEVFDKEQA